MTQTTSEAALLHAELEHWLYQALVPLFQRHLRLEPCPVTRLAGAECGPMAEYIRELVKQELASRGHDA